MTGFVFRVLFLSPAIGLFALLIYPPFAAAGDVQATPVSFSIQEKTQDRPGNHPVILLAEGVRTWEDLKREMDAFHPEDECRKICKQGVLVHGEFCGMHYPTDDILDRHLECIDQALNLFQDCLKVCFDANS